MSPETATLADQVGMVLQQMQAYLRTVDDSHSDPADLVTVWTGQVHQLEQVLDAAHV